MAPSITHLLLLLAVPLIVLNASVGVDARPCKTIFISYSSDDPLVRITQISGVYPSGEATISTTALLTVHRVFQSRYNGGASNVLPSIPRQHDINRSGAAFDLGLEGLRSSLQQRARDILVVVAGLLFGVGCGALTAATMFFVWSIVTSRRQVCGSADDLEEVEEVESPNKMGYVTLPTVAEGYEGN